MSRMKKSERIGERVECKQKRARSRQKREKQCRRKRKRKEEVDDKEGDKIGR